MRSIERHRPRRSLIAYLEFGLTPNITSTCSGRSPKSPGSRMCRICNHVRLSATSRRGACRNRAGDQGLARSGARRRSANPGTPLQRTDPHHRSRSSRPISRSRSARHRNGAVIVASASNPKLPFAKGELNARNGAKPTSARRLLDGACAPNTVIRWLAPNLPNTDLKRSFKFSRATPHHDPSEHERLLASR